MKLFRLQFVHFAAGKIDDRLLHRKVLARRGIHQIAQADQRRFGGFELRAAARAFQILLDRLVVGQQHLLLPQIAVDCVQKPFDLRAGRQEIPRQDAFAQHVA